METSNIPRHHVNKQVHEGKCIALSIYIKEKKITNQPNFLL